MVINYESMSHTLEHYTFMVMNKEYFLCVSKQLRYYWFVFVEQVAVLLRVASLADLVFLMNHVMRCPPGFPNKIARLIQFPMPQFKGQGYSSVGEHHYWDNPLVHHFVAMLAAVLRPIRYTLVWLMIDRQAD